MERTSRERTTSWLDGLVRDVRDALRALRRRPLFALVGLACLALGIGATTALSSLVDAVLLAPLPARQPERLLYVVLTRESGGGHFSVRYHDFLAWREADAFAGMTALRTKTRTLGSDGDFERVSVSEVLPSYFATLGVEPVLGRPFDEEDLARGERLVLLSHGIWQRRFGGSGDAVGRRLVLDGEATTILGVMPPGLDTGFLGYRDLWTPLLVDEAEALATPLHGFGVIGRLRDGVEPGVAEREVVAIAARLAASSPATDEGWTAEMHPVRWWIFGSVERPLLAVFAVSVLVLAVACGTLANLMLSEVAARRQAAAVRKALGAPGWRLVRAFLVESLLLAFLGGLLGLFVAAAGVDLLGSLLADELPRFEDVRPDLRTLGAMLAAAFAAALASGLAPALALARAPAEALRGRGSQPRGAERLKRLLVTAETALAVVAVVGAALCVRSLQNLRTVDPGFVPRGLLTLRLQLPDGDTERRRAVLTDLLARIEALPGVERAGASGQGMPLVDSTGSFELFVEGRPRAARPDVITNARHVTSGYREAMGIPLAAGRWFDRGETWEKANAVVVNEVMAQSYWGDREAIGRWVEWQTGDRGWVVGVLSDVRTKALYVEPGSMVYVPWGTVRRGQALAVRTGGDPGALLPAVRSAVAEVVPGAAVYGVATGEEIVAAAYGDRGLWALLLSLFAVLAVTLGGVGLYGVLAHWVTGRERELGIMMALGALPGAVVRQVIRQGLGPVLAGAVAGLGASLVLMRYLEGQLYALAPDDPATFAVAAAGVVAAAALVCALPARRAARIDPAVAVREE